MSDDSEAIKALEKFAKRQKESEEPDKKFSVPYPAAEDIKKLADGRIFDMALFYHKLSRRKRPKANYQIGRCLVCGLRSSACICDDRSEFTKERLKKV